MTKKHLLKSSYPRIDFTGGTLDLFPLNLIFERTFTINAAIAIKVNVSIEEVADKDSIEIYSTNYQQKVNLKFADLANTFSDFQFDPLAFGPLSFCALIYKNLAPFGGVKITLDSKVPAGSGLGGSSALGIVFAQALNEFFELGLESEKILEVVRNTEGIILGQGIPGYQDYYPGLYGGVLALEASTSGVIVHQFYNSELKDFLEQNLSLIFTGISRDSGINNWEVYKGFFEKNLKVTRGLKEIAKISLRAYEFLKSGKYDQFIDTCFEEGQSRQELFSGILPDEVIEFEKSLNTNVKICGAGGGGCFFMRKKIADSNAGKISDFNFSDLGLKIVEPIR